MRIHNLILQYNLTILDNTIIDVTELIKEEYEKDLENFKVLTSRIVFIISNVEYRESDNKIVYGLHVFSDKRVTSLDQINLTDILGLFDIDLIKFKYLPRCTFHHNLLYNKDQFDMIPATLVDHVVVSNLQIN